MSSFELEFKFKGSLREFQVLRAALDVMSSSLGSVSTLTYSDEKPVSRAFDLYYCEVKELRRKVDMSISEGLQVPFYSATERSVEAPF